jgi:Mn-dependent DtxR family transcriptional regulator
MTKQPEEKSKFVRVEEVAQLLDVSVPHAYKIMRDLNKELRDKGYIVTAGRLSRKYFEERMYG